MINKDKQFSRSTELLRSFWTIQKNMMGLVQRTAVDNGLSVPQYSILMTMMHNKEMIQKTVREKTLLPKSTLSQAIDGLVQLGYLERQQVEDNRREMQLSISEKGRDLIQTIHLQENGIHQLFHHAVNSLTDNQFQDLLHIHKQITSYLKEQGRDCQ